MKEKLKYGHPPYARLPIVFTPAFKSFDATTQKAKWIWLWMLYLDDNESYQAYREAKHEGNETICKRLEAEFPLIADIYTDWGDLFDEAPHPKSIEWKLWLFTRRHLFFGYTPEIEPVHAELVGIDRNKQILQIPTGLTTESILSLFRDFVNEQYESEAIELEPNPSKYILYAPNGRLEVKTYRRVEKSFFIRCFSDGPNGDSLTNEAIALKIIDLDDSFSKSLGFGEQWNKVPNPKWEMDNLDSLTKMVRELRTDHKKYITNTIHGKFPCKD